MILVAATWHVGCSSSERKVANFSEVDDDDPEMRTAIENARQSLPSFWELLERHPNGESDFALKVRIEDTNGAEHFWVTDIDRNGGITTGTINNDPEIVKTVKTGQRIAISEKDISDWLYMKSGKMYGNETLRPLLKTMPADDAEKLRRIMAKP